jgi:uncharacterized protein (DUF1697 family)
MPQVVAFLRAINVGVHVVTMERLRELFEEAGCEQVETFIASGNVIFSTKARNLATLEAKLEKHMEKALGYEVKTFLRTVPEVEVLASYEAFNAKEAAKAHTISVGFLAEPLGAEAVKAVNALQSADDTFHHNGRELFWLTRISQADSKLSNAKFEKALKANVTFRNVNTVVRLAAKYGTGKAKR